MYPELFRIGSFPINTYGVFLAIAILAGILVAVRLAERDGLPRERIYDLCLWMLLAGIIGSKILMLFTEPEYRDNPWALLSLDFLRSGGVFYGGLIGAVVVGYFLMKRYQLPWWKTADACAPGIALGNFFGRQGCFAAGCCWGEPTTLPWGVKFTELGHKITGVPIDQYLHPTQLYESFAMLLVFVSVLAAQTQTIRRPGAAGLRVALLDHSFRDRVCTRRSARRHTRPDDTDRTFNLADDQFGDRRRCFDSVNHS
jgi:phosphatidylglycerol---prolipoprotein diacylglyceryl transferase